MTILIKSKIIIGSSYNYYLMQERVKVLTLHNEETGAEDKYALALNPIGEGKYAKVYKAQNMTNANKVFAVKVIKIENDQIKREYLKELKIIQSLPDCPNLVKTHKEHLESKNNLYIFQEYCESGTLMNYRAQKFGAVLTEDEIFDLFYQVTNGLITLLQAGIVHEDIKPVNILKKGPVFKLCDFGVSELQSECKETTTRKGTISYMPPEKLKSRRFLPNEKSDIYSLGTCIYEIIFGFHPYLKKKTANYKEYLQALEQSNHTPIPILMKKVKSSSLRLENFLKFLERMIDLNQKNRVNLSELKEFIKTTEPFKFMTPFEEKSEDVQENQRESFGRNYRELFQSVIDYKRHNKDELSITTDKQKQMLQKLQEEKKQAESKDRKLKEAISAHYQEENTFFVDVIGFLIRGIDYIRRSNFNELNLSNIDKNVTSIELTDCKVSRYLKYLIYQFSNALRKKQITKYHQYLSDGALQNLQKDVSYLNNEFNKFLIESTFSNKQAFGDALDHMDKLELWREISQILQDNLKNVSIVKENKKEDLLSILYCCYMPKLFAQLANIRSIFSEQSLQDQLTESYLGDTSIENGRNLLLHIFELQSQKIVKIRQTVQKQLQKREIQVFFEIQQESGEIQIIEEEDLE